MVKFVQRSIMRNCSWSDLKKNQSQNKIFYLHYWYVGHAVAQLAEALCYKLEGRGIDSQWCHWDFLLT